MYEIGVVAQFEAAHRLVGDFGPATRLHGHTYRVEVSVSGERLHEDGTLVDIALLRSALDEVTGALQMRDLDEVAELGGVNTTAEHVAEHIARRVASRLRGHEPEGGGAALRVRVEESPSAWAVCTVELPGESTPAGTS